VQLTAALLCDYAEIRDGLLFVIAAPITRLSRPQYPAQLGLPVALVVEGAPAELVGLPHEVQVLLTHDDDPVGEARLAFQVAEENVAHLEPGERVNLPLVIFTQEAVLPEPGIYSFSVRLNGGEAVGQPELTLSLLATVAPAI
jgi:hypothetical protein